MCMYMNENVYLCDIWMFLCVCVCVSVCMYVYCRLGWFCYDCTYVCMYMWMYVYACGMCLYTYPTASSFSKRMRGSFLVQVLSEAIHARVSCHPVSLSSKLWVPLIHFINLWGAIHFKLTQWLNTNVYARSPQDVALPCTESVGSAEQSMGSLRSVGLWAKSGGLCNVRPCFCTHFIRYPAVTCALILLLYCKPSDSLA